jgi:hypothetical protein
MLLLGVWLLLMLGLSRCEVDVLGEVSHQRKVFKRVFCYWSHLVKNEERGEQNCESEDFYINVCGSLG